MMAAVAALLLFAAPERFDTLAAHATQARETNQTRDAVALYRKAVAQRPGWTEGWWYIGSLLYQEKDWAEAVPAFQRFLRLEPKSGPARAMLGLCEFQLNRYEDSLRDLLQAKPLLVGDRGQIAQAARYHRAALETGAGRFDAALDELKDFAFPAVESPSVIEAIGAAALHVPSLPGHVPADQREIVVTTGRAVWDSWAAQSGDAAREYQDLLLRYPANQHLHFLYGSFLLESDSAAGLRELRKCLELDPVNVAAMLQIAFESLKRGEPADGLPYAEKAAKLAPDSFVPHQALGRILVGTGDLKRGTEELETAVRLSPETPECHFALASAYTKANRKQDAAREHEAFVRLQKLPVASRTP